MGVVGGPNIVNDIDDIEFLVDATNAKSYTSGLTASDLIDPSREGILTNGVVFIDGIWDLDGMDDYVDIPFDFLSSSEGTIDLWVKADSYVSSGDKTFLGLSNNSDTPGYEMLFSFRSSDNKIYVQCDKVTQNTNRFNVRDSAGSMDSDRWHNIVITKSSGGTSGTNYNVKIYKNTVSLSLENGNAVASTGYWWDDIAANSDNSRIGSNSRLTVGGAFEGKISNLKLYDRELTATEVLQNYNSLRTRFGL